MKEGSSMAQYAKRKMPSSSKLSPVSPYRESSELWSDFVFFSHSQSIEANNSRLRILLMKNILEIKKQTSTTRRIGMILALINIVLGMYFHFSVFYFEMAVLFFCVSWIKIIFCDKYRFAISLVWFVFSGIFGALGTQALAKGFTPMMLKNMIGCTCIIFIFLLPVLIVTANYRIAFGVGIIPLAILCYANSFVFDFRGNALLPTDLWNIKTAMNVASNYHFQLEEWPLKGLQVLVLFFYISFSFNLCSMNRKKTWIYIIAEVGCVWVLAGIMSNTEVFCWGNAGAEFNGYLLNYAIQTAELTHKKIPKDYSTMCIDEMMDVYKRHSEQTERKPHIIAIMNESFADMDVLDSDDRYKNVMPFYHELQENTIKGYALSSVFGGSTSSSEYEFLSGNSMAFLNNGVSVYQLYLRNNSYSIARELSNSGYKTIALHPYYSDGWSRDTAWEYLGFKSKYFIEDFPQLKLIREYVSDQETYEFIVDLYEKNNNEQPMFVFGVTMQNHGGYEYDGDGIIPKYNEESDDISTEAKQYLGLLQESDKALEYLISYYKKVDYPVEIVFFGDHFPKLDNEFFEKISNSTFSSIQDREKLYKIPFFIWTNYDIQEEYVDLTSICYLSNYVYKASGLEMPPYNQFLQDMESIIPALNPIGYFSSKTNSWKEYNQEDVEEMKSLNLYKCFQYNSLFDKDNRNEYFFPCD